MIEDLFVSKAVAYRETTTRDQFGDVIVAWAPRPSPTAPNGFNARLDQAWSGVQQDHGPGEQQSAKRRCFLHRGFDVAERDVLSFEAGVGAPLLVRIHSVTEQPRRTPALHHIEVNVEVWNDSIPPELEPDPEPPDPEPEP